MSPLRLRRSRWWWLALSLLVSVVAVGVLYGLYVRQREARQNEQAVRVYAAQLDQAVSDLAPIGAELISRDPDMLNRVAKVAIAKGIKRAETLRDVDPAATRELVDALQRALTGMDGEINQIALLEASAKAQRVVTDLAAAQAARADAAALTSLLGSFGALTLAVLLVGGLLTRERRSSLASAEAHAAQIRILADHDGLTGLPNRRRFDADLVALAADGPAVLAGGFGPVEIALCDLDGLKGVNDRLGHHAGDAFLVAAADALRAAVGTAGTVYRIGGDEFCVLSAPGAPVGDAVRRAMERKGQAPLGSVGVATWPLDDAVPEAAVHLADDRMYAAKRARRAVLSAERDLSVVLATE